MKGYFKAKIPGLYNEITVIKDYFYSNSQFSRDSFVSKHPLVFIYNHSYKKVLNVVRPTVSDSINSAMGN
jgi:hypothetical protein